MALADPQSITISGVVSTLPRVETNPTSSVYRKPDGVLALEVNQSDGPRVVSSLYRLTTNKITTDPLSDLKSRISANAYIVVRRPKAGFTETELVDLVKGLVDSLSASTYAQLKKLLGLES